MIVGGPPLPPPQVVSSGYGMSVPIVEREITYRDPNETFSPELIDSKVATEIRRKVVSSKYGARTAQVGAPSHDGPRAAPCVVAWHDQYARPQ